MKKILVPVDFSDVCKSAVQFAIQIAEKNDAQLTLLNSVHFDYFTDYQFTSFATAKSMMDEVKEAMDAKMGDFIGKFETRLKIKSLIHESSLISSIKELVKEEGYDLVVVGTHGASGFEEALIGSNTEKVVRHAPCPVISVPRNSDANAIKRILIPIDIRELKDSFFNQVAGLQKQFGAKLEFLWVKTPHNIENEENVSKELSELIKQHGITNFEVTIVRNVFPSDGILWHADDTNADMIAMQTHARRGLSHWLSGSLTEDTVNHIKVPVWSFKMDKKEKSISLNSVKNAHGKPEYKKIEVLTS
ncbi:universal stress protein [Ekhidna sp.]|jgi:nucleotide-binding universal stress UspA family protein|uniref:universal stress protein n=1 Tax=Ekhidna sp. TaxID=2608089 RepID=UPI0032ECBC6C